MHHPLLKLLCRPVATLLVCASLSLGGCGLLSNNDDGGDATRNSNERVNPFESKEERERREQGSILGEGGLLGAMGFGRLDSATSNSVNKYLWQASIETTQVLPVGRASYAQGVIETSWYAPQGVTGEQMRLVVLVAPGDITRAGVKVNAFRRTLGANGQTIETPADPRTIAALEEAILNRARQLRLTERFG